MYRLSNYFALILSAIFLSSCATGTRPYVGTHFENYFENYSPKGNRRFRTDVKPPDFGKKTYNGQGVELGITKSEGNQSGWLSVVYTEFKDQKANAQTAGSPEVSVDAYAVGYYLGGGYNLIQSPITLSAEIMLKYQTYYFNSKVPYNLVLLYPDKFVSHSSVGAGLACRIPLGPVALMLRGYATTPIELDNPELDSTYSIDLFAGLILFPP